MLPNYICVVSNIFEASGMPGGHQCKQSFYRPVALTHYLWSYGLGIWADGWGVGSKA